MPLKALLVMWGSLLPLEAAIVMWGKLLPPKALLVLWASVLPIVQKVEGLKVRRGKLLPLLWWRLWWPMMLLGTGAEAAKRWRTR